jgi:SET domain-containing protein
VVSQLNVRFEFGKCTRPPKSHLGPMDFSEPLIKVYAMKAIKAGEELVADYGSNYWGKLTK